MSLKSHVLCKDGVAVFYTYTPSQKKELPVLVFLHGWAMNYTACLDYATYFEKKGYGTILIDIRGHGQSVAPEQKLSLERATQDLSLILDSCAVDSCVLCGYSLGGMIAQEFFLLYPSKVSALILVSTSHVSPIRTFPLYSFRALPYLLRNVFRIIFNRTQSPYFRYSLYHIFFQAMWLSRRIASFLLLFDTKVQNINAQEKNKFFDFSSVKTKSADIDFFYYGLTHTFFFVVKHYYSVMQNYSLSQKELHDHRVPTLVFAANKDAIIPPTLSYRLARTLEGSYVLLKGADHLCLLQKKKEIIDHIDLFLTKENLNNR